MSKCENWYGCFEKASWVMKGTVSGIGIKKVKLRICDKCYNIVNPERKRRLVGQASDEAKFCSMLEGGTEKFVNSDVVISFRKIR